MTAALGLFDDAFFRDPYAAYAGLRDTEPVRLVRRSDGDVWLMSRHADVRTALADPRLSKDWRYTLSAPERAKYPATPIPMMILMDPPEHTRLRKLVSRVFTLRRMEALRPRVEQLAAELIAALPRSGEFDVMAAFAFPLPVFVICELLGVPATDRDDFASWSNVMVDESTQDQAMDAGAKMHGYLSELIATKRSQPDDALISALIADTDDDRLSGEELVAMAMLLLIAGHETTVNLIGNGMLALLTRPAELARLQQQPALLPALVEEVLRWDSPVHTTPVRFAVEDVEYADVTIPAGSVVCLSLAAANRDAERFADAEAFDPSRDTSGHVAFGHGLHHCLGAQLARIEGQEAIGALVAARPDLRLAVDAADLVYRRSTLVRGLRMLPVRCG